MKPSILIYFSTRLWDSPAKKGKLGPYDTTILAWKHILRKVLDKTLLSLLFFSRKRCPFKKIQFILTIINKTLNTNAISTIIHIALIIQLIKSITCLFICSSCIKLYWKAKKYNRLSNFPSYSLRKSIRTVIVVRKLIYCMALVIWKETILGIEGLWY